MIYRLPNVLNFCFLGFAFCINLHLSPDAESMKTGLDVCEQFMDVNDMIKDEDLIVQKLHSHGNGLDHKIYASASVHNIQRLVAKMVPCVKRPSARELNLLKRKAKSTSKDQGKVWSEDSNTDVSNAHNTTAPKGAGPELTVINKVFKDSHNLFLIFFFGCHV